MENGWIDEHKYHLYMRPNLDDLTSCPTSCLHKAPRAGLLLWASAEPYGKNATKFYWNYNT
jgi:hypothetical protein